MILGEDIFCDDGVTLANDTEVESGWVEICKNKATWTDEVRQETGAIDNCD